MRRSIEWWRRTPPPSSGLPVASHHQVRRLNEPKVHATGVLYEQLLFLSDRPADRRARRAIARPASARKAPRAAVAGRVRPLCPADFIRAQLCGIVGLRLPITRIEGKRKMSQNRSAADRAGVAAGVGASERASDRAAATLIPA